MERFILFTVIILWQPALHAQVYQANDREIDNAVVAKFSADDKQVVFARSAKPYSGSLKLFSFNKPQYRYMDTTKLKLDGDWLNFLNRVDTGKIIAQKLDFKSTVTIDKKKFIFRKVKCYVLSDQVISDDRTKAIMAYDYYSHGAPQAGGLILLERRDNKWVVKEVIRIYIAHT